MRVTELTKSLAFMTFLGFALGVLIAFLVEPVGNLMIWCWYHAQPLWDQIIWYWNHMDY